MVVRYNIGKRRVKRICKIDCVMVTKTGDVIIRYLKNGRGFEEYLVRGIAFTALSVNED